MALKHDQRPRRIVFLTGTRADFGKMKPLMQALQEDAQFEVYIYVTGMHMLARYGSTVNEIHKARFQNIYAVINQNSGDSMDHVLAKTVTELSDYTKETRPDLLIVHGDRVEALAGAIVGALNNITVAHIEGGEVSGTIDESIRHSVSKLSNLHFVANMQAEERLLQLGEAPETIFVIGSPDIDIMNSDTLPTFKQVQNRYEFDFERYQILLFHPVTTEIDDIQRQVKTIVDQIISIEENTIVILPNNDQGTRTILQEYERFNQVDHVRVYPSMRFEHFLVLLKNARTIIGNSSTGIREAPHFGVPTVNVGSRQNGRAVSPTILNVPIEAEAIQTALRKVDMIPRTQQTLFGTGDSAHRLLHVLSDLNIWNRGTQKTFIDRPSR